MALGSDSLSAGEARRIALAAQGLAKAKRNGSANWMRIAKAIADMGLLQIDSVNVLIRSHYLPVYSRAGRYQRATLDQRTFGDRKRRMFEYWAHEASLLPLELHPLMRWRMERAARGNGTYKGLAKFAREQKAYVGAVLEHVKAHGRTAVGDLPDPGGRTGNWWGWNKGKIALEYLFDIGAVTAATRINFERIYDLPERVIPAEVLDRSSPTESDAIRALVDLSGRALGIASEADLRDYFRLPVDAFKNALPELVEAGRLRPVAVEGWRPKAYLHAESRLPRKIDASTLLSPFDPLVWERSRAERLFGFRYRIEIYTPAHKRTYGYYVLPFLHDGQIAARVCLKSNRSEHALYVNSAHHESHIDPNDTALGLAAELKLMADWLGLGRVEVGERGNFASALKHAMGRQ
jgi:uncharacterized protein YcaQ